MKKLAKLTIGILLFGLTVVSSQAAFSSFYVFGDGLSCTASGANSPYFYGGRYSNGRVWLEVLAQRQGLSYNAANNNSYYDHSSTDLLTEIVSFKAPQDVANDLFVLWVCNADTFDAAQVPDNSQQWTLAITQSQANHLAIITALYAKGVRTLIMPNAVDISKIPAFNAGITLTNVEHNGCIAYNTALANTISQARLLCPGLTIYTPDFYTLLNNVLTNASYYGLTNALSNRGFSIDAYSDPSIAKLTLNGQGTNYIFWDPQDPTAKLHEIMADTVQQIVSPVKIGKLAPLNGSNRLDVVNYPAGLNGSIDGSTNLALANWSSVTNITSSNTTQSFFVIAPPLPADFGLGGGGGGGGGSIDPNNPGNGGTNTYVPPNNPAQFYRLNFPFAWNWP
jgi:outer membrane lipase/esterase